jgi:hypothetical protein
MSRSLGDLSRAELGALVCEELGRHRIDAVLVGGAVVSIYSEGRYVSDDLDFVTHKQERALRAPMESLGFKKEGMYWTHPETQLLVQFVSPPVMVGNKYVAKPAELRTATGTLTILSPLDCVLDRLAWYLSHDDRQCLEQAVSVGARYAIDMAEVERWTEREGGDPRENHRRFEEFRAMVAKAAR